MSTNDRRFWLLTWTTYGTWLPGDKRGFVSSVPQSTGPQRRNNIVGTPYDRDKPRLAKAALRQKKHETLLLDAKMAHTIAAQFQETAAYRGWTLLADAIMTNHIHLVVEVPGDPQPDHILRDFKSYASRKLNTMFGRRERWWTESGSKRKLADEAAVIAAVRYVRDQHRPLLVWLNPESLFGAPEESAG